MNRDLLSIKTRAARNGWTYCVWYDGPCGAGRHWYPFLLLPRDVFLVSKLWLGNQLVRHAPVVSARALGSVVALACLLSGMTGANAADRQGVAFFEKRIRPVLVARCYKCHSAEAKEVKGELLLDTRAGLRKGGASGTALVPGNARESRLLQAICYDGLEMPPDGRLSPQVIADFERWINIGAPDPRRATSAARTKKEGSSHAFRHSQHWSFQPLSDFQPPKVRQSEWVRTPIDRFVLARQEDRGVTPSGVADRSRLIRRAYFDLLGLPPTAAEVRAFVGSSAPDAYPLLIDRLLRSQHYGERWARYWLDVARFAESNGFERDEDRTDAFHYRDFVIKALNADMPYDQFVRWQTAGDMLAPGDRLARTATGFLVAGTENIVQTEKEFERDRYDKLDDMAATVGTAMLGLTIGCARCHDHKYDPIPQREYYRFVSAFGKTVSRSIPLAPGEEPPTAYAAIDVDRWVDKRDVGTRSEKFRIEAKVHFLVRGDVNSKGEVMTPGYPQVLMRGKPESYWNTGPPRASLARWLTDVDHGAGPLLARVIANRLWQHHFGTGLVDTPSDFGTRGGRPSHPKLLDWLARELIRSGWRLKRIHWLMMTSSVYMQSYRADDANARVDPGNRLLWRRSLQRLQAEGIRDAVLAVSGTLDSEMYGAGRLDATSPRRSIYLTVKRSQLIGMLHLFDSPDALQSTGSRQATTVAPQALFMLNSPWVQAQAECFALRIDAGGEAALDELIHDGFMTALARPPSADERQQMRSFVERQVESFEQAGQVNDSRRLATSAFCQLLMCLNEFIYVE